MAEDAWERVLDGNPEAFTRVVEDHQDLAFTLALRVLGDRGEAEEVAQEAFLKAWQARGRFRRGAGFAPWLARIVWNLALDRRRSRSRHPPAISLPEGLSGGADPETEVLRREELVRVYHALEVLPDEYRRPLVLTCWGGLSGREAATRLGIPVTVLKNRTYRARRLLRKILGREE